MASISIVQPDGTRTPTTLEELKRAAELGAITRETQIEALGRVVRADQVKYLLAVFQERELTAPPIIVPNAPSAPVPPPAPNAAEYLQVPPATNDAPPAQTIVPPVALSPQSQQLLQKNTPKRKFKYSRLTYYFHVIISFFIFIVGFFSTIAGIGVFFSSETILGQIIGVIVFFGGLALVALAIIIDSILMLCKIEGVVERDEIEH